MVTLNKKCSRIFRKRNEKPPAKKSTKPSKVAVARKSRNVETSKRQNVETTKTSKTSRDIELPKSKQEVFKIFNLSTTNQILQVIL